MSLNGTGPRDLVELRIHGVSGTSPESLLEYADTVQVAGNKRSGFYRRRGWNGYGAAEAGDDIGAGTRRHLEAFSWGGLTSGSGSRAAWLLLLPFALINVAAWAHPPAPQGSGGATKGPVPGAPWRGLNRSLLLRALRVLGLVMTLSLVTCAAGIGLDMLGWQCPADEVCADSKNFVLRNTMPFLQERGAGARLALTAALPVVVLAVLWALGRWSYRQYECVDVNPDTADADRSPFACKRFWGTKRSITRLRALHVAASFAVIAGLVAYPLGRTTVVRVLWGTAAALVGLCVLTILVTSAADLGDELDHDPRGPSWFASLPAGLHLASVALLAATLAVAPFQANVRVVGRLPGYGFVLWALSIAAVACLAAVTVTTAAARSPSSPADPKPFLRGLLTPVLATLGVVIGAAMVAGATYVAADFLARVPGQEDAPETFGFALHSLYLGAGVGVLAALALLVVAAVVMVGVLVLQHAESDGSRRQSVAKDYDAPAGLNAVGDVARARYFARLTEKGAGVLAAIAVAGMLTGALAMVVAADPGGWVRSVDPADLDIEGLSFWGSRVIVVLTLALVAVGSLAYRKPAMRRTVGVLWDLATFWPRAAHPLAPPCYCERTVPQLTKRVGVLAEGADRVLLSAHSQGSIMALAALLQLPVATTDNVGLVSHGSPLRRLYARAFPGYFNAGAFDLLRERFTGETDVRWRNCWRKTDYLGGHVFDDSGGVVDVHVLDPPAHAGDCQPRPGHLPLHPAWGDIVPLTPLRHSNYYVSGEYNQAVWDVDVLLTGTPAVDLTQPRQAVTLPSAIS